MREKLTEIDLIRFRPAVLQAVKELQGKCKHGNPSYYDVCKYLDIEPHAYLCSQYEVDAVVASLYDLEKKGLIEGYGGYYLKGTHSGAGAKKWAVKR